MGIILKNRRSTFRLPHSFPTTLTSILLSRFANLEPYHSRRSRWGTPCLPFPTLRGGTPYHQGQARGPFGRRGLVRLSRFGQSSRPDFLKVPAGRFARQPPKPLAVLIVWHGAQGACSLARWRELARLLDGGNTWRLLERKRARRHARKYHGLGRFVKQS